MNGATADVWAKTIKNPSKRKITKMGASQYFFLTLMNSQNSLIIELLDISPLFLKLPVVTLSILRF